MATISNTPYLTRLAANRGILILSQPKILAHLELRAPEEKVILNISLTDKPYYGSFTLVDAYKNSYRYVFDGIVDSQTS
jgi:hypothetical protein